MSDEEFAKEEGREEDNEGEYGLQFEPAKGWEQQVGEIFIDTESDNQWTQMKARCDLAIIALNFAKDLIAYGDNSVDMKRMVKCESKIRVLNELLEDYEYLKTNPSDALVDDSKMRARFGSIVGYKAIPYYSEYSVMAPGDREKLIAGTAKEYRWLYGELTIFILGALKFLKPLKSRTEYNAIRFTRTNPEMAAKLMAEGLMPEE